jgi:hypothetical protein
MTLAQLLEPIKPDLPAYSRTGDPPMGGTQAEPTGLAGQPRALYIEMQLPSLSVARILQLAHTQPAVTMSVRFDDPMLGMPVALTVVVLRPELFRVVVTSDAAPLPDSDKDNLSNAWAYAMENWLSDPDLPVMSDASLPESGEQVTPT